MSADLEDLQEELGGAPQRHAAAPPPPAAFETSTEGCKASGGKQASVPWNFL